MSVAVEPSVRANKYQVFEFNQKKKKNVDKTVIVIIKSGILVFYSYGCTVKFQLTESNS